VPTYGYKCPTCGKVIEEFHAMNENPRFVCDTCGNAFVKVVSGGTNTLYKSPGFTQYKGRNGQ